MIIKYEVLATIINLIDKSTSKFTKTLEANIEAASDVLLYNNHHLIAKDVLILDMFKDEIDAYCKALEIEESSIQIDEFEMVSLTDRVDIYFEFGTHENEMSMRPTIKCYVYPRNDALKIPELVGVAYDSTTIIWSWPEDEAYAHYLVEEAINPHDKKHQDKIVAQLPIGTTSYTETNLKPDTVYTRRLINYTDEQTSVPSASVTVRTETVVPVHSLEEYNVPKNYDFTTDDSERFLDKERFKAFHSGVGDFTDLKVYKQMDADFYQKFKTYFELTGRRIQREKRYDQVGFNYKICLEAIETIEEQEGEVTFDINVYPREWVILEDYMWASLPVTVKVKFQADVFLRKETVGSEPEEVTLKKPSYHTELAYKTVSFTRKLALVLSIDQSGSMDTARQSAMKTSMKALIDTINDKAAAEYVAQGTTMPANAIQFIIIEWAAKAALRGTTYSASDAKAIIDAMPSQRSDSANSLPNNIGHYTCWAAGLNWRAVASPDSEREEIGLIFFTDGFLNSTGSDSHPANDYFTGANFQNACLSSYRGAINAQDKVFFFFGCNPSQGDRGYNNNGIPKGIDKWGALLQQDVPSRVTKFVALNGGDITNADFIKNLILQSLDIFQSETVRDPENDKMIFDGWVDDPDAPKGIINKYEIDTVKVVTVTSDIYSFTFNNTVTPIEYSRPEKRAIIPVKSFLENQKISSTNLYDLIMQKVKQTPEWLDGYNKTIGTVEPNGEPDSFLICGLFIWDTYEYGDEDNPIASDSWGQERWEEGMEGTVNAYTDIDRLGTTTYGDDCYLVSKSNYLMMQGYTDAIIYDGIRFVNTELNAYDRPTEVLISAGADYGNMLYNRKKPSLQYTGSGPISHCIDVVQKDRDIVLSGCPDLQKAGDWKVLSPLSVDIVGSISVWYWSPILNYRFNLEDPDAKTPLYEILPMCNPKDDFRNIVILHVYYAKNVWITNKDNYVASFGDDPIATTSSPYIPLVEGLYKWTLKEWKDGINKENGWFIDEYLWFMAKPMMKTQEYYDELPGPGMETFYGLVNGRYRTDNQDGKQDLRVDTPQFNIPTTVHKDTIKIYIVITEFYPPEALVGYRWEHPYNEKDSITQVNGDYVTFFSDSITYKDVEYLDVIATINRENQEIFDQKTQEYIYEITKPETVYEYVNYYLEVTTDNSDVLAMRYPTEITFDEDGKAAVGVAFKGVVNATSRWSPRIHNGYYYLNQHEYYAYCEFDVEANFETYDEQRFKTINGYLSFDVLLRHKAKPDEHYSITKNTRSELLQNENEFQWINGKGLTLKPIIDGEYYREYVSYIYYSPIIMFRNVLTDAGKLVVDYNFDDGSSYLPMEVRSYNIEEGKWSDWQNFVNNTVPAVPLSSAYQVRFTLQASVQNSSLFLEDYMCCYLDWKDDMNEANTVNIVTITDHMTVGPDEAPGTYISRIIDYGCVSELMLDIFESGYHDYIQLSIAFSNNNPDSLLIENCVWTTCIANQAYKGRYFRYKIVIPYGEKLYWLHKRIQTLETHEILPFVTGISMTGTYSPKDVTQNFINTEAFEIPKDGEFHTVFERVLDVIGADVLDRGFTEAEIESVKMTCTTPDVEIEYDHNLDNEYPAAALATPISAKSEVDIETIIKNTPYIFTEPAEDETENTIVKIAGTPQQYAPITVEDPDGNAYIQMYNKDSFIQTEEYVLTDETKYIELPTNRYDPLRMKLYLDGTELDKEFYNVVNHLVIFNDFITAGHTILVEYCILYSFIPIIDRKNNTTTIYLHTGEEIPMPEKVKVFFETSTRNNKFIANELSLNPIYRTDYSGFIYLTDDHNEPYEVNIYCNPTILKAGGFDSVDISVEVLDIKGNPVISKDVAIDCQHGILTSSSYVTDMNGVVHVLYESSYTKCMDIFKVRVLKDDGTPVEQSIEIINE